jgi:RAV-like factor
MKLPSSQYRGVVAQQSGKWGAQIYKNDERIWLGTFCTEFEAAQTYDLAARCLHGTHAVTNLRSVPTSDMDREAELQFLKSHTTSDILSMLRRHTYHEELKRSRHMQCSSSSDATVNANKARELLFFKAVSPGDVGPQNRLLVPRQHAQKHFPLFGISSCASRRGVMINFEDEKGKIWKFRYAYWSSSATHVLNGGWAEFAREKGLKPGDMVQFWRVKDGLGEVHLFIECHTKRTMISPSPVLDLPTVLQPDKIIRLFGFNVSASLNNT